MAPKIPIDATATIIFGIIGTLLAMMALVVTVRLSTYRRYTGKEWNPSIAFIANVVISHRYRVP